MQPLGRDVLVDSPMQLLRKDVLVEMPKPRLMDNKLQLLSKDVVESPGGPCHQYGEGAPLEK